jgi:hypothetical protein
MKNIIVLLLVFGFYSIALGQNQDESESTKKGLKNVDLVLGGSLNLSSSNNDEINDFILDGTDITLTNITTGEADITKSIKDIKLYTGVKLNEHIIIGGSFRNAIADLGSISNFGTAASPLIYEQLITNDLTSYGLFLRYTNSITDFLGFGVQPYITRNTFRTGNSFGFTTTLNRTETSINTDFTRIGLNAQVIFKIYKRFNIVVSFGRLSFIGGKSERITTDYLDNEPTCPPIIIKNDIRNFNTSFNGSTVLFSVEVVL